MADRIDVMISSTAKDLPEHRKQAIEAILRMSMHPIAMEHLPAKSEDAIDASLAMVDEAEIYLGIIAHRYGYIPDSPKNPDKVSITELEFRRAVERDIPRLIFVMGDNHPITSKDLETDPDASAKLLRFKKELTTNYVVKFFNSMDELREQIITSLAVSPLRKSDAAGTMHYISDIPKSPVPYIAHPYTLLQTSKLAGRQKELNLLTDWVAKPDSDVYQARILNIVAIGGMGKSALTWKWFNEIAPQKMKPLAGAMWWSFYESDARFENFVIRALAYVTGRAREDIEENTNPIERENALLKALNEKPYLIVMDGLERILVAYARMDAAYLADDDLDEQTANRVAGALGLPESAGQSFFGQNSLRKTTDPRIGNFLRKLATVKQSRLLVSTRLYPADLQTVTGSPIPGSYAYFLTGLSDNDALELWRAMGVSGSRDALLPLFKSFDNYPLLIRVLAGEVARYRRAPGDFDAWRKANPDFNPLVLPLIQVKSHVLAYALQGLNDQEQKVLHTVAAFRMPATYDTLAALMIGDLKQYKTETEFDSVLADLEDRGLVGWDKQANRYDLHPIVRGVVWESVIRNDKQGFYESLYGYFESLPQATKVNWHKIKVIDDLIPVIELYNALIGMDHIDEACEFFHENLSDVLHFRLGANRQSAELLELLLPNGLADSDRISNPDARSWVIASLALSYHMTGSLQRAIPLYYFLKTNIYEPNQKWESLRTNLYNLSEASRLSGRLYEAQLAANQAIPIAQELAKTMIYDVAVFYTTSSLLQLALILNIRGLSAPAKAILNETLPQLRQVAQDSATGINYAHLAEIILYGSEFAVAAPLADNALMIANASQINEYATIKALRVKGEVSIGIGKQYDGEELLQQALNRARITNFVAEELPCLISLGNFERQQGEFDYARELLEDVWEAAERGPFPVFHADAMNVLAQIERDEGNTRAAIEAATKAYKLAWCDGISADGKTCYAYWWGLQAAKKHLEELGAPIPVLPPFDESKFEPLPEIDWDKLGLSHEESDD